MEIDISHLRDVSRPRPNISRYNLDNSYYYAVTLVYPYNHLSSNVYYLYIEDRIEFEPYTVPIVMQIDTSRV